MALGCFLILVKDSNTYTTSLLIPVYKEFWKSVILANWYFSNCHFGKMLFEQNSSRIFFSVPLGCFLLLVKDFHTYSSIKKRISIWFILEKGYLILANWYSSNWHSGKCCYFGKFPIGIMFTNQMVWKDFNRQILLNSETWSGCWVDCWTWGERVKQVCVLLESLLKIDKVFK